jgi:hypothetical protein
MENESVCECGTIIKCGTVIVQSEKAENCKACFDKIWNGCQCPFCVDGEDE